MSLFTQNLNLTAVAGTTAGSVTLGLNFVGLQAAPGAGTLSGNPTASPITTPIVDADGLAITVSNYVDFTNLDLLANAPTDQSFLNYALTTNTDTLKNIGTASSYSVGTQVFAVSTTVPTPAGSYADATSAFNAAMNALLGSTVDTAGGRAAIQFVVVDAMTKDSTITPTGPLVFSTSTPTVISDPTALNLHVSQRTNFANDAGGGPDGPPATTFEDVIYGKPNLNVDSNQLMGILRLQIALKSDPAIGDFKIMETKPTAAAKLNGSLQIDSFNITTDTFAFDSAVSIVANGTPITFKSGLISTTASGSISTTTAAIPTGLTADTNYYAVNVDDGASTFQLSASPGGGVIDITGSTSINLKAVIPVDVSNLTYSATANAPITFTLPSGADIVAGQAVTFASSFGGTTAAPSIVAGTTYFVYSVSETNFTVTKPVTTGSGSAVTSTAALSSSSVLASIPGDEPVAFYSQAGYVSGDLLNIDDNGVALITGFALDLPSRVAVSNSTPSSPRFQPFSIDIPTINALGALGDGFTLALNVAPQSVTAGNKLINQYISVSLAQADALASNGVNIKLIGLESGVGKNYFFNTIAGDLEYAPTSIFKIRDSALNIQNMTVEQANNLNTFIHSIEGGSPTSFGPQLIDVTPIANGLVDTTPIAISFDVAQTLANNDIRINQTATVSTDVKGAFGTVTGDDLLHLVDAGVDKINFDNSTLAPVAPATVGVDPFAGQNVRSVVMSSQDLAPVSKMNITGLRGNNTIDVTVVVDDSSGNIQVPGALMAKMGVDRVIADDGMLDIHLNDARNLLKTGVLLGGANNNSDVRLIVDTDRDFANLKGAAIAKFAASGVDVISYGDNLDFHNNLSQSKNFIDTISSGTKNGIVFDLSNGADGSSASLIHLNLGVLGTAGIGQNFVSTVNSLDDMIYLNSRHSGNGGAYFDQMLVQSSGIRSDWVSLTGIDVVDNTSESVWDAWDTGAIVDDNTILNTIASMTKVVAKANASAGSVVLLDMQYNHADNGYSLAEVLYHIYDNDGDTVDMLREMTEFGKTVASVKNLYADLRVSGDDTNEITSDADFQSAIIKNINKLGFKGVVVDENAVNDYASLDDDFGVGRYFNNDGLDELASDILPLAQISQSLDIVYQLDASSASSSVGLSEYLYADGSLVHDTDGALVLKDDYFNFKSNVSAIDKIIITNAQDGDMSLDLSEFGVYGGADTNFKDVITHTVNGGKATTSNELFEIKTSDGKYVQVQIVGLLDYTQFNAADLKAHAELVVSA